jgi:hypothetical protein
MDEEKKKLDELAKKQREYQAEVDKAIAARGDALGKVIDQIFGTEALKKAATWTEAMNAVGMSVNNLRVNELEELNTTMLAGIDALMRSGNLTSAQSSEFAELAIQAQAALAAMRPLVTTTNDLVKAQWDYVTALDEANKKAADVPPAMAPAKASIDAIGASAQQAAGGFFSMSAGLYNAIRAAQNEDAKAAFSPAWGITHPAPGQGIIRHVQPPPMNYFNITQPLGTPDQIARAVGSALTGSYSSGGGRLPA